MRPHDGSSRLRVVSYTLLGQRRVPRLLSSGALILSAPAPIFTFSRVQGPSTQNGSAERRLTVDLPIALTPSPSKPALPTDTAHESQRRTLRDRRRPQENSAPLTIHLRVICFQGVWEAAEKANENTTPGPCPPPSRFASATTREWPQAGRFLYTVATTSCHTS